MLLPREEASLRIGRLHKAMDEAGIDGLLVADNADIFYLSGRVYAGLAYIPAGMAPLWFVRRPVELEGDGVVYIRKLEDVIEIKVLKDDESVYRELIMVKVRASAAQRSEVISIADIFRAKIVDVEKESMMIELTGNQSKLEAFLNLLDGYEILELARTGITGLARGIKDVTFID